MPDASNPTQNPAPENPPEKQPDKEPAQSDTPAPGQEEKLNSAVWLLLATGAGILDLVQLGLEALVVGAVLNLLIDIFVGLSLGTFFLMKGMLNWKTGISIFLGFAVDFISDGIAPAWILDIGAVWLFTDGGRQLGKIPFVGEQARQAALMAAQKGKGGAEVGELKTVGKEAAGASATAKSAAGGKSIDGIKPGTGGGAQKTA